MAYSVRGRVLVGAALLTLGSAAAGACGGSGNGTALGSGDAGAPSTGGTTNSGGASSADAGASNTAATGGTLSQGDAGMPATTEGGTDGIGPGCNNTLINPCTGLPHFTGVQTVDGDPSD